MYRILAIYSLVNLALQALKLKLCDATVDRIVIDDEDPKAFTIEWANDSTLGLLASVSVGRVDGKLRPKVNVEPLSSSLSTQSVPPMLWAKRREIAKASPVPPRTWLLVKRQLVRNPQTPKAADSRKCRYLVWAFARCDFENHWYSVVHPL